MINPSGKYGYTLEDVKKLCKEKDIQISRFWEVFGVNTILLDEYGDANYSASDIERTLHILGDKDGIPHPWD